MQFRKRIVLWLVVATLLYGIALFVHPQGIRSGDDYRDNDWLSVLFFRAWLHQSVHEYGAFPLWCPFVGGGYPTIQHPSDDSLTPFAAPVLLFGEVIGVKINLLVLLLCGVLGMYGLARTGPRLGRPGATFAAAAYLAAGWFPSMMLVGFYNLAMFHLIPGVLALWHRALDDRRFALPAGVALAIFGCVAGSGLLTAALFLLLLTVAVSWQRRDDGKRLAWRPWLALAIVAVVAGGVGAVKFGGLVQLTRQAHYAHGDKADYEYDQLKTEDAFYENLGHFAKSAALAAPRRVAYRGGQPAVAEYSWLGLPWAVLGLFFLGAWWGRRRLWPYLAAGGVFLVLCFGPHSPLDLYRVLIWPWPPLRAISQFYKYANYFLVLTALLAAGAAIDTLAERFAGRRARRWVIPALFASLLPFAVWHASLLTTRLAEPPRVVEAAESFYQVRATNDPLPAADGITYRELVRRPELMEYFNLRRGVGTIDWYADLYLPESARPRMLIDPQNGAVTTDPDYRGEAWFDSPVNRVGNFHVGANSVTASVAVAEPGRLTINLNHLPGWRCDRGEILDRDGLMSLDLTEAGEYDVRLRYRPPFFFLWLVVSLISLVACAAAWMVMSRRRAQS
ncbi:MAG: hypothetical protein P9L99_10990 [Candidatus Lernaella stagnicola]|nr:hypothetical protein [Candidatus Lernaella stagnicola]